LEDVTLNHVAERSRRFIKTAAALDAKRFRSTDLHVIDVIPVPKRLENAVAKTQHEQVLNGVLAQIVIDAVDLLFVEDVEDNLVQSFGGSKISSEGLLNNDANPGIRRGWASESGASKLLDDVRINFRRRGKIKQTVAADVFCRLQFREAFGELSVGIWIRVISGRVIQVGSELVPLVRIDRPNLGDALGRFTKSCAESIFRHGRTRKAHGGIARPQ